MPRKLAAAIAAAIAFTAAVHDPAASAAGLDGFSAGGSGYSQGLAGHGGAAGASSRPGAAGPRSGSGYPGTSHRYDFGGHQGSGWYQPGFGGNLNPGWGYGFGPQLGGPGH
jgi:hypothetical protein